MLDQRLPLRGGEFSADDEGADLTEPGHNSISIRSQCELIGLSRASLYYEPVEESADARRPIG